MIEYVDKFTTLRVDSDPAARLVLHDLCLDHSICWSSDFRCYEYFYFHYEYFYFQCPLQSLTNSLTNRSINGFGHDSVHGWSSIERVVWSWSDDGISTHSMTSSITKSSRSKYTNTSDYIGRTYDK